MRTFFLLCGLIFFLLACQSKKKMQQDSSTDATTTVSTNAPNKKETATSGNQPSTTIKKRVKPKPLDDEIYAADDTLIIRNDAVGIYNVLVNDYVNYDKKVNKLTILSPPQGDLKVKRLQGVDKIAYQTDFNIGDQDEFTYQICDEKGKCDTAHVLIVHCPPRNASLAEVEEIVLPKGESHTFTYEGKIIRPDRSALFLEEQLMFSKDSSSLTYQPENDFVGSIRLNFNIYEHWELCGLHRHAGVQNWIYVIPTEENNKAPIAKTDEITIKANQTKTIHPLENDSDPEGTLKEKINKIWKPQKGTAKYSRKTITYTPDPSFNTGKDEIRYQICDYNGKCAEGKVIIIVK